MVGWMDGWMDADWKLAYSRRVFLYKTKPIQLVILAKTILLPKQEPVHCKG
jgi:hypothetical protein